MELKRRDPYFDNAKGVLIILVVLGHFIEPINSNKIIKVIFEFIYLFHMPAFIFISGYFSKPRLIKDKSILKFAVLYVLFQIIFIGFTHYIGLKDYKYNLSTPAYVYWYIFALCIWNILMKIIVKLDINIKYLIMVVSA